ncbi:ARM repeat-containing protein [Venustampulla echinocandica]|uniref:ARM repeat-containing protein n=1 Tax=Venustampulla echinocandica TaxID=2656787 RepID=A0A370TY39_9HELO|nr:ARM repeat-containing protein [Venustampulla echinocandica]RDL40431.1 ARM repeat-containing protein [Venustampulla echinocandica]
MSKTHHSAEPIELSFPLPKAPDTRVHLSLTIQATSSHLFLTTKSNGDTSTPVSLGSFVYAIPDRYNPGQTLSTPLYTHESTLEFTTRLAKLLAQRTQKPVYVGNSISFADTGMGGTVEEEMEGFRKVVEVVTDEVKKSKLNHKISQATLVAQRASDSVGDSGRAQVSARQYSTTSQSPDLHLYDTLADVIADPRPLVHLRKRSTVSKPLEESTPRSVAIEGPFRRGPSAHSHSYLASHNSPFDLSLVSSIWGWPSFKGAAVDMAWQPEQEALGQLASCLKDSLSGHNKNVQKQAETMLAQAKSSPDINNYLTYLFSSSETPAGLPYSPVEYHAVRAAAATMLKNNIRTGYKTIPPDSLTLVRSSVPLALQDKNQSIRNYAGNVITQIVTRGGILGWPQLLPELLSLIGNEPGNITPEAQEGAMDALAKVCEDNRKMLDKDYQGQRPLTFIIPKLIDFTVSDNPKVRSLALGTLNVFIPQKPQALLVSLDDLLNRLFQLANDPSSDVRRQVCRAFVQIVEIRPDKILPHIGGLVDYMIAQQKKIEDEELACDAAEFWLTVGEHGELWKSLAPYLNKIIPVLLESMVYSDEDIAMLEGGGNDADEEDRAEDIKPTFAKTKGARILTNGEEVEVVENGGGYAKLGDDDDDLDEGEIEEFDDDDDDDDNPEDRWNLRKCSAAALDVFATDFRGPVFETILPYLMTNLRHEEWPYREAAVLALGAVAEGCLEVVTPHLPDLVPYLISLLNDPEPLVRQITCWTLGRYSSWGANLNTAALRAQFFEPMMEGILTKMLDNNKRVQEAGASAFAHLEEKAGHALTPYCEPIIRQFVRCFEKYKDRNMFILYDCVQTLAEHVGHGLAQPQLIDILMPALIHRWNKVSDQSKELFPLLECLSYVATALSTSFAPFAQPVFARCTKIIHQNLEEYMASVNNPILDTPDKDFLVTSLDLVSAIVQAVDQKQSAELVSGTQPGLFDLLTFCMEDAENEVRQSAYAVLGDCAKYAFPQLRPFLPTLLPILIQQLDLDQILDEQIATGFSVLNNACWSAGEIAIQYGKELEPYVGQLLERYLHILGNPEVPRSVLENSAIALGRLGLDNSGVLAPVLSTFSEPFLKSIHSVEHTVEKATAMKGFCLVVLKNPQAMEKDLARLFTIIARYNNFVEVNPLIADLRQIFQHTLETYKSLIPDMNAFLTSQIAPADVTALRTIYSL